MAELLTVLVSQQGPLPDFSSSQPPPGLEPSVWALRPSKYQYSSPLKSVTDVQNSKPNEKKPEFKKKKKIKLFSTGPHNNIIGKAHKSFSMVEENLAKNGSLDGIGTLPCSPNRSMQPEAVTENKISSPKKVSAHNTSGNRTKYNPANSCSDNDTPPERGASKIMKKTSSRFTPSPQAFSLSDFLTTTESKRGNKKGKQPRSPVKVKTSTPVNDEGDFKHGVDEHMPPIGCNLDQRLANIDLESKDLFPDINESFVARKRRIKPIQLGPATPAKSANSAFGQVVERSASIVSPFTVAEVERKTVDDREMVKESVSRRTPLKSPVTPKATPLRSSMAMSRSNSITSCTTTIVSPLLVTNKDTLSYLSDLYAYILLHNLMPNLIVEVYFLIELLTVDAPMDCDGDDRGENSDRFFSSAHNCVFFAAQVLERIVTLLSPLDGTTLRLLHENVRLAEFCPALIERLAITLQTKTVQSSPKRHRKQSTKSLQNISFQSETDNRSNFPSNSSFHDFKKQRDKFYSLIRRWGDESKGPDYEFQQLSQEAELVMVMHDHPINYCHFARLFRQQLVAMCLGEDGSCGQGEEIMSELKKTDPMKYKKLAARLTTPVRSGGPCPLPTFTGAAEFFRDFVANCSNPKFIHHLRDSIATEIQRLDQIHLEIGGCESWGSGISKLEDSSTLDISQDCGELLMQQYQEILLTLRVLAKFLGFLESFPYACDDLSEELSEAALSVRASTHILNLTEILNRSMKKGRLVLTLPWIVEFLCQLDQVTLAMPAYRSLLLELVILYQTCLAPGSLSISSMSAFFLSLLLGWLFEGKHFPREHLILARLQQLPTLTQDVDTLDLAEVVGQELLLQYCPWVGEIRTLLQQWEGARRGSLLSLDRLDTVNKNYRKITPVAAPIDRNVADQDSALQANIEKNFFHNQPAALRRTVDFLAERLASNIIRKIRTELVSEERAATLSTFEKMLKEKELDGESAVKLLTGSVTNLAHGSLERIRSSPRLFISLQDDCAAGLQLMLSTDTSAAVRDVCKAITNRVVKEKVKQYVTQHVTLAYFSREYRCEAERMCRKSSKISPPPTTTPTLICHKPEIDPPSRMIVEMKLILRQLLVTGSSLSPPPTSDTMLSLISRISSCLSSRADITTVAIRGLESLSLDLLLTFITHYPSLVIDDVINAIVDLWQLMPPPQLVGLICPRNLVLFTYSSSPKDTWALVEKLLDRLIEASLLPVLALEDSCLALRAEGLLDLTCLATCLKQLSVKVGSDLFWVEELFC